MPRGLRGRKNEANKFPQGLTIERERGRADVKGGLTIYIRAEQNRRKKKIWNENENENGNRK
jgi:hypothetical protein